LQRGSALAADKQTGAVRFEANREQLQSLLDKFSEIEAAVAAAIE
jgi:hypothetical protein